MIGPFLDRGLDGAIYGFAVETSVHALRMIIAGVFDRFPDLKIVLGHLGEGLPFWLYRLDYMHGAIVNANRYEGVKPTKKRLSEYLKENFYFTTSGMPWEPAILFTRSVIGRNRVMYAMDYPYQFNGYEVEMTDNLALSPAELREFYESIATRVFSL
jgi:2,3-dihydroxybenzoate decarboxylase